MFVFWSHYSDANLISESEENIDQEENSVNDSQTAFRQAGVLVIAAEWAMYFANCCVVPVLDDKNTGRDEHYRCNQRVEDIETFIDWSVQEISSEHSHQNDWETNKSSVDQHNLMMIVDFAEGVVVKTQTCQCEYLLNN